MRVAVCLRLVLAALGLFACAEDEGPRPAQEGSPADSGPAEGDAAAPAVPCPARFDYDPLGAPERLTSFPDDRWTVPDPEAATGLRVQIGAAAAPWLAEALPTAQGFYQAMEALDGFGTSAPVFLRLEGTFPALAEAHPGLRLYDLGEDPPVEVPYEPVVLAEGQLVALWPARPLRGGTPHAAVITAALEAAEGCIDPSPTLAALLRGEGEGPLAALAPRFAALPGQLGLPAEAIRGASLFTTQTLHATSQAIAADIAGRSFAWLSPPECRPDRGAQIRCEGRFLAHDYRDDDGVIRGTTPTRSYALPVSVWFPASGEGPWPTYLVGHGLGGDRGLGGVVSRLAGDAPIAVVAVDAVAHGAHPGGASTDPVELLTRFFAVDLASRFVDGLALRDNFRQSTYDKLQALALVRQVPDVDGDGRPELDLARQGYFGFSLGGIMGSELLALDDGLEVAILGMPGGRLSSVMRDGAAFATLLNLFVPRRASDEDRERLFGALQTVVEAGDPVNYGPHVLSDRLSGAARGPHTLMVMAVGDEVVPNSTTAALARAWQIPPVRPVLVGLPFLPEAVSAPVAGNLAGVTAGLVQYREISQEEGVARLVRRSPATHDNVMLGREAIVQVQRLHEAWAADALPPIVSPADAL